MYGLFIQIFIDAAILWMVLSMFHDTEVSLGTAAALGFFAAIITGLLTWGLTKAMGTTGFYVGLLLAAVLLGVVLSAVFGFELKRAIMIAGIFMSAHFVVWLIISKMMEMPGEAALLNEKLQVLMT